MTYLFSFKIKKEFLTTLIYFFVCSFIVIILLYCSTNPIKKIGAQLFKEIPKDNIGCKLKPEYIKT